MATFAPSAQHPMICEHNHELLNSGDGNVIEGICGESFETDDGLPSFEDCLLPNNSNANNVRTLECFFSILQLFLHLCLSESCHFVILKIQYDEMYHKEICNNNLEILNIFWLPNSMIL